MNRLDFLVNANFTLGRLREEADVIAISMLGIGL